jgi:hypothetical protein
MQPEIDNWFTYHAPTESQQVRYQRIREAAKALAQTIADCCPDCTDRTAAFRQLRETVMTANQSIACNETPENEKTVIAQ